MRGSTSTRPAIFAMSNPTNNGMASSYYSLMKNSVENYTSLLTSNQAFFFYCPCVSTAECTPEEAFSIVGDNIIFASGSPFKDFDMGMYECISIGYSVTIFVFDSYFNGLLMLVELPFCQVIYGL